MSYVYHAMSAYFDRDNVALPGMASYFRAASEEERTHAQELMDFQVHCTAGCCNVGLCWAQPLGWKAVQNKSSCCISIANGSCCNSA